MSFFYSKKYDGDYCIRNIFGIKIITKPHYLKVLNNINKKMDIYNDSINNLSANLNNINNKVNYINELNKRNLSQINYVYTVNILGDIFYFQDSIISDTPNMVAGEINNGEYTFLNTLDLKNKTVIDIGANLGIVSIVLAKKNPGIKIYAFEPLRENYENLLKNIELNGIDKNIITVENKAVTKDGRNINMSINLNNKGGSSISDVISVNSSMSKENCGIESITLEEIVKKYKIDKIDLLKIDCEGSEYEILYNTKEDILKNIDYLVGEFHENKDLTDEYDIDKLCEYLEKYIKNYDVTKARHCFVM
ncbi:FkbM family methyltransferase [Brachyspira pilosicoli]|uniref:FkbM family methyltransferase n=1 Tax=Brachyspira pilosicoli TaxID=52584 RepID=UPI000E1753D3|nr:FkbM family methyltransferase [Brachyspira pilosicoli]SUW00314.1 SAM-dependent methyltransferase [Brachyspira pilosicoli]